MFSSPSFASEGGETCELDVNRVTFHRDHLN
jgi:hypothetical protein